MVAKPIDAIVNMTKGISSRCKVNHRVIHPRTQMRKKTYVTRFRNAINRNKDDCFDHPKIHVNTTNDFYKTRHFMSKI